MIKNKKHIIFDWNGTLVDDTEIFVDVLNELLEYRNLPKINIKLYKNLFCVPVKDFYSKIGIDTSNHEFRNLEKQIIHEYKKRMFNANLFEDTVNTLKKLKSLGYSMSILSASHQTILDNLVQHYQINHYFLNVMGVDNFSANGKYLKGKQLIDKINYKLKDLVYIGDIDQDYLVSNKLNIDCILISRGHQAKERLEVLTPFVIGSMVDLCKL